MARNTSSDKRSKTRGAKSEGEKRLIEIGRKLAISVPAGLFLLAGVSTGFAALPAAHARGTSAEAQKLRSNEVAGKLMGYAKGGSVMVADCGGIHGNTHVNKNNPNVTTNGKHGNVHSNNHGDSCRYYEEHSHNTTPESLVERLGAVGGLNVIFQVTDRCVLSCRYCFAKGSHGEWSAKRFMDPGLLDEAIKQSFAARHDTIAFEWTGGEPFLAGIDFYRRVAASQKKHANKPFTNTVQTSGYLFDRELIDFFVENGFHLSMTIDGPEEVHDFNRPAQGGKPSLRGVLKTRDYIVEKQGSGGAIATVTKKTLGKEGAILDYYGALGINYFHSNPYIYFDGNLVKDSDVALSVEEYASYFVNQFNAWFEKGRKMPTPVTIDYILQCLSTGRGLPNTLCAFGGRCLTNFAAIVPNGDVYPCPKFTGSRPMLLGNIGERPLADLLSDKGGRMEKLVAQRASAVNKCEKRGCDYLYICNGGCPYYSFIAGKGKHIRNRDCLCKGKSMVFRYLEGVMMSLAPSGDEQGASSTGEGTESGA